MVNITTDVFVNTPTLGPAILNKHGASSGINREAIKATIESFYLKSLTIGGVGCNKPVKISELADLIYDSRQILNNNAYGTRWRLIVDPRNAEKKDEDFSVLQAYQRLYIYEPDRGYRLYSQPLKSGPELVEFLKELKAGTRIIETTSAANSDTNYTQATYVKSSNDGFTLVYVYDADWSKWEKENKALMLMATRQSVALLLGFRNTATFNNLFDSIVAEMIEE